MGILEFETLLKQLHIQFVIGFVICLSVFLHFNIFCNLKIVVY